MNHIKAMFDETLSMCGELLGSEFYFKTIEAAVWNGNDRRPGAPVACSRCTCILIEHLKRGSTNGKPPIEKTIDS